MADTANNVVVAIEAQMGGFSPAVTQGAQAFDASMRSMQQSASQMEQQVGHSLGNTRIAQMELMHVVRGSADSFASGTPPMMIFTQHLGMMAEAGALAGGSLGRVGEFLGGPWGIATMVAVAVLGTLISRIQGASDAFDHEIEKLTENAHKTDNARAAQEAWAHTIPGIVEAIRSETQALEEQNRSLAENQNIQLNRAQNNLNVIRQDKSNVTDELQQAREALRLLQSQPDIVTPGGTAASPHGSDLATAQQRVRDLEARLQALGVADQRAQQLVRDAQVPIAQRQAEEMADPIRRITDHYEDLADAARMAAHGNDQLTASLAQTLAAINRHRDAELDAARAADHQRPVHDLVRPVAGGVLSQFGADRSGVPLNGRLIPGRHHDGVDLRGNMGDPVVAPESGTATVRSAPGGLGLYVEIRADSGARDLLGHLSQAFGPVGSSRRLDAGDILGAIGNSGNAAGGVPHLHWQRQVNRQWVDPMRSIGSSGAAQEAQQQANLERTDEEKFRAESARLDTEILQARRRQVETEDEATAADLAAISAEQAQRDERIRHEADERTRRDASQTVSAQIEAGLLLAKSAVLAATQRTARLSLDEQRHAEERITIAMADIHDAESVLQAHAALARAIGDRRDIELRLLDLQHQEEILAIQKQRAQQNLDADQRAQLDRQEAASNERYGLARQGVIRQNRTPLEQFFADVPRTAREMDEALQTVATDGLTALNDGLAQAAGRFLHLGGVAGQVLDRILADMIQIVLHQGELALFGGGGGAGFGSIFSSLGQLFHGSGAVLADNVPALAGGGVFGIGGYGGVDRNVLSINGQPRAMVSADERVAVIPQGKALSFGGARAASSAPQITIISAPQFDLSGAVMTPQLMREVDRVSRQHAANAAAAMGQGVMRAVPARLIQYQSDGL